jgi:hypothetical protein
MLAERVTRLKPGVPVHGSPSLSVLLTFSIMRLVAGSGPSMVAARRENGELIGGSAGPEPVADQAGELHWTRPWC